MATRARRCSVRQVVDALQTIADPALAQEWDNVGLIAGDPQARCTGVLLCIDMTAAVVDEAAGRANLIAAYHPPIFKPIQRLTATSPETDACVLRALHRRMHVYAMHTALDAAEGGTNDVIAALCGLRRIEPFEDVPAEPSGHKVVVFVPTGAVERVADAMFHAGAGRIGQYERCSFRTPGTGTFFGTEQADPAVGERGRLEHVEEIRLEAVVGADALAGVLDAIRRDHSYEEPAIDVYPLKPSRMRPGIGRVGQLPRPMTLGGLAGRLRKAVGAPVVHIVGARSLPVRRVAICVGSAGRLPDRSPRTRSCDAVITGEINHHDALHWARRGATHRRSAAKASTFGAIALGHWHSERPVLASVADRLRTALPDLRVEVSRADKDPFTPV